MSRPIITFILFSLVSSLNRDIFQNLKPRGPGSRNQEGPPHTLSNFEYGWVVNIGSDDKEFLLSLAILNEEIWVQGVDCNNFYEPANSTTSVNLNSTHSYSSPTKKLELQGSVYRDQFNISGIIVEAEFNVANRFIDPSNLIEDGMLGLGKDKSSIIYKIYEQGEISAPIYSLLNIPDDGSYLILGELNFTDLSLEVNEVQNISLEQEMTGELSFCNKTYPAYPVRFSSTNSYIMGPYEVMQDIYTDLIDHFGCYYVEEYLVCECDGEYEDMSITVQGVTLVIPSSAYLMTLENACFLFADVGNDEWVLGEPLLKNYLVSVDLSKSELLFHSFSQIDNSEPSAFDSYEGWIVVAAAILGSLVIYVAAAGIYQLIKKKMESEEEIPLVETTSSKKAKPI